MGSIRRSSNQQNNEESLELNINTPPTPDSPNSLLMMSVNPDLQSLLDSENSENEATTSAEPDYIERAMSQPAIPGQSAQPSEQQELILGDDANSLARQVLDNLIAENIFEEPEAKRLRLDPELLSGSSTTGTEHVQPTLDQLIEMEQATPMETECTASEMAETAQAGYSGQPEQSADMGIRELPQPQDDDGTPAPNFTDEDLLFVRQLEVVLEENKRSKAFSQFIKSKEEDQEVPRSLPQEGNLTSDFENTSVAQRVEETSDKNISESKESSNEPSKTTKTESCEESLETSPKCPLGESDASKSNDRQYRKRKEEKSESHEDETPPKIQKTDTKDDEEAVEMKVVTDDTMDVSSEIVDTDDSEKSSKKDDLVPSASGNEQKNTESSEQKDVEGKEEMREGEQRKTKEEERKQSVKRKKGDKGKKRQGKKYFKKNVKEKVEVKGAQDDSSTEDEKKVPKTGYSSTVPEESPGTSSDQAKEVKSEAGEAVAGAEGERAGPSRPEGLGGDSDGVSSVSESTGVTLRARPPTPAPVPARRSSRVHRYPERLIYSRKDQF